MVRTDSLFGQLLSQESLGDFEFLVARHWAERYSKGFSCWTQLVAMLFSQLARADSLREICNGMSCCLGKLVHMGVDGAPSRSTLSYANAHRKAKLFEDLFWTTAERFRKAGMLGQHKPFRFKNKLLSLDSRAASRKLTVDFKPVREEI